VELSQAEKDRIAEDTTFQTEVEQKEMAVAIDGTRKWQPTQPNNP
jgi:hypothetical protein